MSFFTLDSFQQYHEQVGADMPSKLEANPESPSHTKPSDKQEEKRPSSPSRPTNPRSLSAQAVSELDPFSALNLARAADPWLGNSLLTPTACSYLDNAEGATASAVAATSLKVVAVDHSDDDWGDFVTFSSREEMKPQLNGKRSSPNKRTSPPAVQLPNQGSGSDSDNDSDSNNSEPMLRNDHVGLNCDRSGPSWGVSSPSMMLRNNTPTHAASTALTRQPLPNTRSGESKGFAATLLDRLLSLGTSSPRNAPTFSPKPMPKRNYDSYDVTFDHGPVGLDLETDWYGRQAVVKGFRAINSAGDEGPAKRCGLIHVGDVLTAINGESCLQMNFQETLEALRLAGKSRHTLHFKSLEAAGDLSIYANDKDVVLARAFIHQHKQRFYRPPPAAEGGNPHELVLGCIERLRGEFVTALNFHQEETGEFLLAASCASDGSGPFIFHTLRDSHLRAMRELPQSEDSAVYLGRLEPSFLGTEFTLFDHHTGSTQQHDNELAFLVYTANVLGRVPNSLKCVVSKPVEIEEGEDDLEATKSSGRPIGLRQQPSGMGSDGAIFNTHRTRLGRRASLSDRFTRQQQSRSMSIAERLRSFTLDDLDQRLELATDGALSWLDDDDAEGYARSMRVKQARLRGERTASMGQIPYGAVEQEEHSKDLLVFETKQPSWNEELGAWTLNFHGRVKVASKKNFLLVGNDTDDNGDEEEIMALRFGKVSKTRFTLDYAAPLAPIQALAVACSAFANKRAVT